MLTEEEKQKIESGKYYRDLYNEMGMDAVREDFFEKMSKSPDPEIRKNIFLNMVNLGEDITEMGADDVSVYHNAISRVSVNPSFDGDTPSISDIEFGEYKGDVLERVRESLNHSINIDGDALTAVSMIRHMSRFDEDLGDIMELEDVMYGDEDLLVVSDPNSPSMPEINPLADFYREMFNPENINQDIFEGLVKNITGINKNELDGNDAEYIKKIEKNMVSAYEKKFGKTPPEPEIDYGMESSSESAKPDSDFESEVTLDLQEVMRQSMKDLLEDARIRKTMFLKLGNPFITTYELTGKYDGKPYMTLLRETKRSGTMKLHKSDFDNEVAYKLMAINAQARGWDKVAIEPPKNALPAEKQKFMRKSIEAMLDDGAFGFDQIVVPKDWKRLLSDIEKERKIDGLVADAETHSFDEELDNDHDINNDKNEELELDDLKASTPKNDSPSDEDDATQAPKTTNPDPKPDLGGGGAENEMHQYSSDLDDWDDDSQDGKEYTAEDPGFDDDTDFGLDDISEEENTFNVSGPDYEGQALEGELLPPESASIDPNVKRLDGRIIDMESPKLKTLNITSPSERVVEELRSPSALEKLEYRGGEVVYEDGSPAIDQQSALDMAESVKVDNITQAQKNNQTHTGIEKTNFPMTIGSTGTKGGDNNSTKRKRDSNLPKPSGLK